MGVSLHFVITVTLLTLVEWGFVHPFSTLGFYCKDPKLSHKKDGETVTANLLISVSFVLPYFVFLAVERFTPVKIKGNVKNNLWLEKTHYWFLKYIHGLLYTFLITDLTKLIVGEPRPHFFDICLPRENDNCTNGQYIPRYTCKNNLSDKLITDSFKSFPSGHASFSCYTALFFAVYFTRQIRTNSNLLLHFLHISCIFWALLCSLTRITDNMHHWWDVLVGAALGIIVATYFTYNRERTTTKKKHEDKEKNKNFKSNLINCNS